VKSWLKRDALNRAWRTFMQTVGAVVIIPAGTAALEVVRWAFADAAAGQGFEWTRVAESALWAAGVGATISILAYLHRMKLDPSRFPSAPPPQPPAPEPPRMRA